MFFETLRVMDVDVRTKKWPPAATEILRNSQTTGHPAAGVRNARGKAKPKSLCLCCFAFLLPALLQKLAGEFF